MIRRYAIQSTLASARLEGRELPAGYVRTPEVQRYIQNITELRKIMTEDKPPELQREGCQCELDYACGGDCCGMMYYTCAMHKALGMNASDIYVEWMDSDD